jgi:carbonic anhydrase
MKPGSLFVHRNIANVVTQDDLNAMSVIQYAVQYLQVEHVIVCGHTKCGGCAAALSSERFGLIDAWLDKIKDIIRSNPDEFAKLETAEERELRLAELNALRSAEVVANSAIVKEAWKRGQKLQIHAWIYDVTTALIHDLKVTRVGPIEQEIEQEDNLLPDNNDPPEQEYFWKQTTARPVAQQMI